MKLAVFDVDGTLLDNLVSEDACYAAALRYGLGVKDLSTDWSTYEHVTDEGVADEAYRRIFGFAPSRAQIESTIELFLTHLAQSHARDPLTPIAGAADLLATLPARGWSVALATGAWRDAARFKLAAAGLEVGHLPLASAEDGRSRVDIIQRAVKLATVSAAPNHAFERVVIVGDGVWDVAAAASLALPFVGRATGERAEQLRARGAEVVLGDYTGMEATLAALETVGAPRADDPPWDAPRR